MRSKVPRKNHRRLNMSSLISIWWKRDQKYSFSNHWNHLKKVQYSIQPIYCTFHKYLSVLHCNYNTCGCRPCPLSNKQKKNSKAHSNYATPTATSCVISCSVTFTTEAVLCSVIKQYRAINQKLRLNRHWCRKQGNKTKVLFFQSHPCWGTDLLQN